MTETVKLSSRVTKSAELASEVSVEIVRASVVMSQVFGVSELCTAIRMSSVIELEDV